MRKKSKSDSTTGEGGEEVERWRCCVGDSQILYPSSQSGRVQRDNPARAALQPGIMAEAAAGVLGDLFVSSGTNVVPLAVRWLIGRVCTRR